MRITDVEATDPSVPSQGSPGPPQQSFGPPATWLLVRVAIAETDRRRHARLFPITANRPVVFRSLRENGPALLVPAAWLVVAATVLDALSPRALFVAHAVMSVLLVAFVVASWTDMASGVLRAWKLVILAGTPVTLAGLAGFLALGDPAVSPNALLAVSLYGWMLLPVPAFAYTGLRDAVAPTAYYAAAAGSAAGAAVVTIAGTATGVAAGVVLVGIGQTIGIVAATALY